MKFQHIPAAAFAVLACMAVAQPPAPVNEEAQFLSRARKLTISGLRAGEGYFSPDGGKITFQSERDPANPFFQIFSMDLKTGDTVQVSPGQGKTTCSFYHPGTDEIMFASTHLDPKSKELQQAELDFRASGQERRYSWDYDEHYDIFTTVPGSGEYKRLTDARGYDAEGGYSPDGKQIVFCSMRDMFERTLEGEEAKQAAVNPSYFGEIYIMNADGSGQTRLTHTPGYDGGPFFTPDGKKIVWRRFDKEGFIADAWTMNPDGTDQKQITDFGCMSWAPYFHPSMKYLAFASNKLGFSNFEVFIVDPEGTKEPVRITHTEGFDGLPVFSPDGKGLAWTSGRNGSGKGQIWLAKWNHEAALAALAAAPPAIKNSTLRSDDSQTTTTQEINK